MSRMAKKEGELWKVFTENIYRCDREERIQKGFELIVPDLAQAAYAKERRKKALSAIVNSKSAIKVKTAQ